MSQWIAEYLSFILLTQILHEKTISTPLVNL